jgi:hypothetical protein
MPPMRPARRGRSDDGRVLNAQKTACGNGAGLLSAFVERESTSPPIDGGGGGTIARSAAMHLAGVGRINSVNFSTCLHRLTRVAAIPVQSVDPGDIDSDGGRPERS